MSPWEPYQTNDDIEYYNSYNRYNDNDDIEKYNSCNNDNKNYDSFDPEHLGGRQCR